MQAAAVAQAVIACRPQHLCSDSMQAAALMQACSSIDAGSDSSQAAAVAYKGSRQWYR